MSVTISGIPRLRHPKCKVHDLKCWPVFFEELLSGKKTFEARRNDRNFKIGDVLHQREWQPADSIHSALGDYTGRELYFEVTYVLPGRERNQQTGIMEGFCVMALRRMNAHHEAAADQYAS